MGKQQHIYELDILRITGIIGIMLFHYTFRGYAADNMSTLYFPLLGKIFKYGYLGIYLFFVLSGYTTMLSAKDKSFRKFVYSRILRLFPSFWVAVCLTTVVTIFLGAGRYHVEPLQFLANLTMLSGYIGIKSVDDVYWFIFILLKFYFLVSMLILLGLLGFQEYLAGIWLVIAIAAEFYHIPKVGFFLIPGYAPFFIAGMIFYSARENGWNLYKLFVLVVSLFFAFYQVGKKIPVFNKHYYTELSLTVVLSIILSIYAFMFLIGKKRNQTKLPSIFITLGACTYPLYLFHQNIGYMLFNRFGHLANRYVILMSTICLMCCIAYLITKYIEPYIVDVLKRCFLMKKLSGIEQ